MLKKAAKLISDKYRKKRGELFCKYLYPTEDSKILDLGSEDGRHIAMVVPFRKNVFIKKGLYYCTGLFYMI